VGIDIKDPQPGYAEALTVEATMWWRLTKAIIVSWLVGAACGAGIIIVLQQDNRIPPAANANGQSAPQTTGIAPASPDGDAR
jgi:hypothetical protein